MLLHHIPEIWQPLSCIAWNWFLSSFWCLSTWVSDSLLLFILRVSWASCIPVTLEFLCIRSLDYSTSFGSIILSFTVSKLLCWNTYSNNFSDRQMGGSFWVLECLTMSYFLTSLLTDSLTVYRILGSKLFILSTYSEEVKSFWHETARVNC